MNSKDEFCVIRMLCIRSSFLFLLVSMLFLVACVPLKETSIHIKSGAADPDTLNYLFSGHRALLSFSNRPRTFGVGLFLVRDTLHWKESVTGMQQKEAIDHVKEITLQRRRSDGLISFAFGSLLGLGIGPIIYGEKPELSEQLVTGGIGALGAYGAYNLLRTSNKRTYYIFESPK
ncbi:MAG: hypothetical protein AB8G77_03385 [Rhodothermales bacterium]